MASRRSKKHLFNSTASGCMQVPVVYSVKRDKESPRGRGVGGVHTRCNCLKGIMTHSHSIERQPQQQHQQKKIIFHSTKLHTLREYTTYQGMLCLPTIITLQKRKKKHNNNSGSSRAKHVDEAGSQSFRPGPLWAPVVAGFWTNWLFYCRVVCIYCLAGNRCCSGTLF